MMPSDKLIPALLWSKRTGPGRWIAKCPAHLDKSPSLTISEKDDGRLLVHCHAGCDVGQIMAAVGLSLSDLFPPNPIADFKPVERRLVHAEDALKAVAHELVVGYLIFSDLYKLLRRSDLNPQHMASIGMSVENLDRLGLVVERVHNAIALSTGWQIEVTEEAQRIIEQGKLRPNEQEELEEYIK